jgi:aspartate 1-decarboxylase
VVKGDTLIIITYAMMTPDEARIFKPDTVFPDKNNKITA